MSALLAGRSVEKERCFRGKALLLRGKKTLKNAKKCGKRGVSRKKWVSKRAFLKAKFDEDSVFAEKCLKESVFRKWFYCGRLRAVEQAVAAGKVACSRVWLFASGKSNCWLRD